MDSVKEIIQFISDYPVWVKICVVLLICGIFLLLVLFRPKDFKKEVENSFVTKLMIWSEIDANVIVDGMEITKIDHRSGFDYAGATVRIKPNSILTLEGYELTKNIDLINICKFGSENCEIRVGTSQFSDIRLSNEEKKIGMGSAEDSDFLISDLKNPKYSARAWALTRLGYINDPNTYSEIIYVMHNDPEPYVQSQAAEALGRIGKAEFFEEVKTAYNNYKSKDSYGYIFENAIKILEFAPN